MNRHRITFVAAAAAALLSLTSASQAAILASWDAWADAVRPYVADDVLAGFSAEIAQGSENRVNSSFGSTDGTFGTESGATTANDKGLLVRGANGSLTLTITLANNTGTDYLVESFHFDFAPRQDGNETNRGPNAFDLTYITGGLGLDNTVIASQSGLAYHLTGVSSAFNDYPDYDIDLSALSDMILADGESAQFTLVFSGHSFNDTSSIVDNVAFVGSTVIPAPAALPAGLGLLGLLAIRRR